MSWTDLVNTVNYLTGNQQTAASAQVQQNQPVQPQQPKTYLQAGKEKVGIAWQTLKSAPSNAVASVRNISCPSLREIVSLKTLDGAIRLANGAAVVGCVGLLAADALRLNPNAALALASFGLRAVTHSNSHIALKVASFAANGAALAFPASFGPQASMLTAPTKMAQDLATTQLALNAVNMGKQVLDVGVSLVGRCINSRKVKAS